MKITHVINPVTMGGGEVALRNMLCSRLYQEGAQTKVWSLCANSNIRELCRDLSIPYREFGLLKSNQHYSRAIYVFRAIPQLIWLYIKVTLSPSTTFVLHSFPMNILLLLPRFGKKHRYAFIKHSKWDLGSLRRVYYRLTIRRADVVLSVAPIPAYLTERNVFWVPNFPSAAFNSHPRIRPPLKKKLTEHRDILFVGRLTEAKGILRFYNELTRIARKNSLSLTLHLIGDGPVRERLERETNSADSVRLVMHGFRNENYIISLAQNVDFAVHPSEIEGFSLVLAQYRALALPCLFFDSPENRQVCGSAGVGFTWQTLEAALLNMCSASTYTLVCNASETARGQFSESRTVEAFLCHLRKLGK